MGKPVVHFEIGCRDRQATGQFYATLFDWSVDDVGPASFIKTGSAEGIGGHMSSLGHEPYHYTMFYVAVEDLAASLRKAESLGGKTLVPPVPIPTGRFAWFTDPEGNVVGLLERKA